MLLFYACLKFQHNGNNKAQHKAGTEKVQGDAVAVGALVKLAQQQGPGDTSKAPGGKDAAVNGAELLGAIYVA